MVKIRTLTFSASEDFINEFRQFCKDKGYNQSVLVRILIKQKMEQTK